MATAKGPLMRNRFQFSFAVLLVTNLFAATLTVKTDGSGDHTTIQAAINASSNGDIVLVYAGTYTENINFGGKNITIQSLYVSSSDTSYISSTIINGNDAASVVKVKSGESSAKLIGLTLRDGAAYEGGGVYIKDSNLDIEHCKILSNTASVGQGGAIYVTGSVTLNIKNSFSFNPSSN